METFLGIEIWPRRLSDSEYVARTRKRLYRFRRFGKWANLLGITAAAFHLLLVVVVVHLLFNFGIGIQQRGGVLAGLGLGWVVGLSLGFWFFVLFKHIIQARKGLEADRSEELMIKYHDALADLARQREPFPVEAHNSA